MVNIHMVPLKFAVFMSTATTPQAVLPSSTDHGNLTSIAFDWQLASLSNLRVRCLELSWSGIALLGSEPLALYGAADGIRANYNNKVLVCLSGCVRFLVRLLCHFFNRRHSV
jgi:hypothetical protein